MGAGDAIGAAEDALWDRFAPRFGCSRLRCASCGEAVADEVLDGWRRRYACGCQNRVVVSVAPAPNPEPDAPFDASTPWSCAGHPELQRVDESDLVAALDDLSSVPPVLRCWPGFAAARLCAAAPSSGEALLERLARIALDDASDVRLARSVRALAHFPLTAAAGRLVAAPLDRWARPDPDVPRELVSQSVARVLGPRVDPAFGDAEALGVLHALAVRPPGVDFVLLPAVWADPAWAVRQALAIAAAAPDAWRHLLQALKHRPADAATVARSLVDRGLRREEILALAQKWPDAQSKRAVAEALSHA